MSGICSITKDDIPYDLSLMKGKLEVAGLPACYKETTSNGGRTRNIIVERDASGIASVYAWPSLIFLVSTEDPWPYPVSFDDFSSCWSFTGGENAESGTESYKRNINLATPGETTVTLTVGDVEYSVTITVIQMDELSFDKTVIPSDGSAYATPDSVNIQPSGRSLKWMDVWNSKLDMSSICTINSETGVVTAKGTGGRALIRVYDEEFPACYREKAIDILHISNVGFDDVTAVANGSGVQASAKVYPADRELVWSIDGDALGCSIDSSTGILTPGDKIGTVTVKAEDSEYDTVSATGSIEICSECLDGTPISIGNVTLKGGVATGERRFYCYGDEEGVTAKIKLTGECCDGNEYTEDMEMEVKLDNTPGIHDQEVASVYVCGKKIQKIVPKYTVVKLGNISLCPNRTVGKGKNLIQATLNPCPDDTRLKWEIVNTKNSDKATFESRDDNKVVINTNWGQRAITVRAGCKNNSSCEVEKNISIDNQVVCTPCETGPTLLASCSNLKSADGFTLIDGYVLCQLPTF